MHPMRSRSGAAIALAAALVLLTGLAPARGELQMPNEEFAKLDPFEGHSLQKADKAFAAGNYRQALAEYDLFLKEFPRSSVVPYALFRKARSLHLDDKRFAAIKMYEELLDFFPNNVRYAAASLFYIGEAHWQNGEIEEALRAWAEMADDLDYSKQPLAAGALNRMADHYWAQDKQSRAVPYYQQVAIDFRKSNPEQARKALARAVEYYVRHEASEPKLREFYSKAMGFGEHPLREVAEPEALITEKVYWDAARAQIRAYGEFNNLQGELSDRYYRYWAGVMDGKFPEDDGFQIDLANFKFKYENNRDLWVQRLDQQYASHQKEGDQARTARWIRLMAPVPDKAMAYYQKISFDKMPSTEILELVKTAIDHLNNMELARNTFAKVRWDELDDKQKYAFLIHYARHRDKELVEITAQNFTDKEVGKYHLLQYYEWKNLYKEGVPLALDLTNSTKEGYASMAWYTKGLFHQRAKEWEEAIKAYQLSDRPPASQFRIAEVYHAWGKLQSAVAALREIENFFKDQAPEAQLRIAYLYRDAKQRDRYVAELRNVLKKYPKSGQSSAAHQELEKLGERIGGAVDEH